MSNIWPPRNNGILEALNEKLSHLKSEIDAEGKILRATYDGSTLTVNSDNFSLELQAKISEALS